MNPSIQHGVMHINGESNKFMYSPSWMCPNTCSLGWTLLWTVLSSSMQPTRCIFLGTQSRKPENPGKLHRNNTIIRDQTCKIVNRFTHRTPLKSNQLVVTSWQTTATKPPLCVNENWFRRDAIWVTGKKPRINPNKPFPPQDARKGNRANEQELQMGRKLWKRKHWLTNI